MSTATTPVKQETNRDKSGRFKGKLIECARYSVREIALQRALQSGDLDGALTGRIDDDKAELRKSGPLCFFTQMADFGCGGAQGRASLHFDGNPLIVFDRDEIVPVVRFWMLLNRVYAE